jgi:hypothetical protein
VLNDAVTSATLSPMEPSAGQTFNVTGYQTVVNLPQQLAEAAGSISPNLMGSATTQLDASGATPATITGGTLSFNVPIPSPVPTAGVSLSLPVTPSSVGPFTATSTKITIQEDSAASLTLLVGGSPLTLTCNAYPNNSVAMSGIVTSAPTAAQIAPIIAVAGGGSSSTTAPPPATTPTTKPPTGTTPTSGPVTAPASSLAFTGVGPGVGTLGMIGGALILLGFGLLVLVDAPRRAMARLALSGPGAWRRMRAGDMAERLASLNPMRWRKGASEGVPDTSLTAPKPEPTQADSGTWVATTSTRTRGTGDLFSRVPELSKELAQTTARHAVRTAQWLLGR